MKPRLHADLIKAWADGAEIEIFINNKWHACNPDWSDTGVPNTYRVKPREFPKTSWNDVSAGIAWSRVCSTQKGTLGGLMRALADEAIEQYILDEEQKAALLDTKHVQPLSETQKHVSVS